MTGTTYAIFTTTTTQEGTNTIETLKCLELEFSNQKNVISLLNTYPMTDERGSKNTPYSFTLTNKCGTYVEYSVGLAINKDNTLEDKYVKTVFSLANDTGEPVLLTDRVAGEVYNNKKTYIFRNDGLENNASKDYKLVLWVDGTASDSEMQKSFLGNIIINTKPIKNEGQKTITVDLDGGNLLQELNEIYREGTKIKLPIPAKAGYHFTKWEVTSGDATIDENNYLTIGKENISLKAYYQGGLTLTLELNDGSTTQTINDFYGSGEKVTLIEPTKEGNKFKGWKITSGNGTLEGNILTINTESVVIEATWKKQVTLTVDLNGGSTTQSFEDSYGEQDEINLTTPTKTNSTFAGWEITSGTAVIDNNKLTFGSNNVSIKALWQQTWNFDFTGSEQTFTAPYNGIYKLEIWGASGGNYDTTYIGGYGGYSIGSTNLLANDKLYINVGGKGEDKSTSATITGGYNGGGNGAGISSIYSTSGGGATHIATQSGLLKNLSSNKSSILIVSGGGGGTSYQSGPYTGSGGSGGGYIGNNGTNTQTNWVYGSGGTQTSGGASGGGNKVNNEDRGTDGSFGAGGNGLHYSGGGGGGYYGGGASNQAGGGGGSGYIGNDLLVNKLMYCYNCKTTESEDIKTLSTTNISSTATSNYSKKGNGYARITFISTGVKLTVDLDGGSTTQNLLNKYPNNTTFTLTEPVKNGYTFNGWTIISGDAVINENKLTIKSKNTAIKATWIKSWTFAYTGNVQTFTAPTTGTYKLETWGAQGGDGKTTMDYNQKGGYGGYSKGEVNLTANQKIYIVVGGQGKQGQGDGKSRVVVAGGYNGGANNLAGYSYSSDNYFGSGGGATHIATESKGDGTLSNYENYQSSLLIVAGGGGGSYYFLLQSYYHHSVGGSGGGFEGQDVQDFYSSSGATSYLATGGKQTVSSGNSSLYYGKFGLATAPTDDGIGGGGGGYYGGASGMGGAGGSGYIGNSLLTNKVMYCYNCTESSTASTKTVSTINVSETPMQNYAKKGNGYARISLIK